jgi:hypothetical protein
MTRINTYVPTNHLDALKRFATHDNLTTADLFRLAVREYLVNRANSIRTDRALKEDQRILTEAAKARAGLVE